MYLFVLV